MVHDYGGHYFVVRDPDLADKVAAALEDQPKALPRRVTANMSWACAQAHKEYLNDDKRRS